MEEVGEDFVSNYLSCIRQYTQNKVGWGGPDGILEEDTGLLGRERGPLEEWLEGESSVRYPRLLYWGHIPAPLRRQGLRHWVRTLVGPESIQRELNFTGPHSKVKGRPADEDELVRALGLSLDRFGNPGLPLGEALATVAVELLSVEDILIH